MAYYKNPIDRYLLRRKVWRKIKMRLEHYHRLLTKDLVTDIEVLLKNKKVSVIFDAGANIGFMTYQFQKRFPEANIYCFEPNPTVFAQLVKNYKDEVLIHCYQQGIADENGSLEFLINANSGTSSFLNPTAFHKTHQAKHALKPIIVPVITLNEFSVNEKIDHIDILKLDIEGYELKALQGAGDLINDQRIDIIITEVALVRQYLNQPLFHEITKYLEGKKYHLYNVDSFVGQETPIRQAVIGNATFISENFRQYIEETFGVENCGWEEWG